MLIRELSGSIGAETLLVALGGRHYGFLLDSALSSGGRGRYCFAGSEPFLVFRAFGTRCEMIDATGHGCVEEGDPLMKLRALQARYRGARAVPEIPFLGGAVGFFSYEFGAGFEQVRHRAPDDLGQPDLEFGFYDAVVALDTRDGRAILATSEVGGRDPVALQEAVMDRLKNAGAAPFAPVAVSDPAAAPAEPVSNMGRAGFMAGVQRIREYIAAGDVYQVNLAHRFVAAYRGDPRELYRRLRERSPAPFGAYLNFGGWQVLSVSPERFFERRGRRVATRPIKGTRPRGRTPEEDARLQAELRASAKDQAELLMIVDLERNDLGRVCRTGSVQVDEWATLEEHPTVWHLVAEVSGELAEGRDLFDLLRASFPGGSITGAPKIRAMQIIAELEPHRRGLYTGSIGYLGFDGDAELNIAIRTLVCGDGKVCFHVGGGITWDSDPSDEYAETLAKGRALRSALVGDRLEVWPEAQR